MPIVKLLDSYKVYSIIKVDPLWRSLVEIGFSGVFSCFFSAETTITTHLRRHLSHAPSSSDCVTNTNTHTHIPLCCSSISLFSLSPSLVRFVSVFCLSDIPKNSFQKILKPSSENSSIWDLMDKCLFSVNE